MEAVNPFPWSKSAQVFPSGSETGPVGLIIPIASRGGRAPNGAPFAEDSDWNWSSAGNPYETWGFCGEVVSFVVEERLGCQVFSVILTFC